MAFEAFFRSFDGTGRGQRFCILHTPDTGTPRAAVVYVHPFAEEMNKSRRMAALQARALAAAGCAVLQFDLLGCGDSSGDFGDATWPEWIRDVQRATAWLKDRHPDVPLWIWGLRAGCLLAADAMAATRASCNFLFIQPPSTGKTVLQQFLRLRSMGERLEGRKNDGGVEELRRQLSAGTPVDVSGYRLAPGLALGLDGSRLAARPGTDRNVWIEVGDSEGGSASPALQKAIDDATARGFTIDYRRVAGPSFWQSSEIEVAPALIGTCADVVFQALEPVDACELR